MSTTTTPEYLLIGHVAHDETPQGPRLGGTVSYAGGAALALGASVAIVTSARQDEVVLERLPRAIKLHLIPAQESTIFVNTYVDGRRRQLLLGRAQTLGLVDVPAGWRNAEIVHLGPLDDEVDPELTFSFPNALVAATPQGWMRIWDAEGVVSRKAWTAAERLLPALNVAVFSEEDIQWDRDIERRYAEMAKLLVITRAENGCTVYQRGLEPLHFPAPKVDVIDATGAGDVFTAVFLLVLRRTGSVERAARAAVELASRSVTRVGLDGAPTPEEVARAL
ncbi:MAG: hypothetical protein KF726_03810 [Anaerolineae bacterium]|nr:hypothetical protein [Anaerolineae bacterium]